MNRILPIHAEEDIGAKALALHRLLCAEYRCPIDYFRHLDPLSELVGSLLSHRTRNADSGAAFRELRRRFPDWAQVRDAPTAAVEEAIARVTWPEMKAPRIQAILRAVEERAGGLDLGFLAAMTPDVAQRTGLIGPNVAVGPSHAILEALLPEAWDVQAVYDHHEVMMLHGQKCCFFRNPACGRCVVLSLCPTGQARMEEGGGNTSLRGA
jgi:endonuclease III